MARHIGIVACSAEGASLCYRTICAEGAKALEPYAHPEVTLHSHSLAKYVECLEGNDWQGVAEIILDSAGKLERAGADVLICPDNTIHRALDYIEGRSPLRWLHIVDVVAAEAEAKGFKRAGLLGTKWLLGSGIYPERLSRYGIECLYPPEAEEVSRIIMGELVLGVFRAESIEKLQRIIEGMSAQECDAVILGCTEIPLVINDENSVLPTLDSTRLLARAALRWSGENLDS